MTDGNVQSTSVVLAAVTRVQRAIPNSRIAGSLGRVRDALTGLVVESALYRWLTREPEPSVVVVDLRETATLGPVLALVDKVLSPVERAWGNSRLEGLTEAVGRAVVDSRVGRLASAVIEPPATATENGPEERD